MNYHFYADDSQIYMIFQLSHTNEPEYSMSIAEACMRDINNWMTINKLRLNDEKTEFLILNARHKLSPSSDYIHVGTELIRPSKSAKNIGVWFDNTLSMEKQVNMICRTGFYHLRNIATIRKFLSCKHCEILIHAFVTTRLDYCNSLFSGLPQYLRETSCTKLRSLSSYPNHEIQTHYTSPYGSTLASCKRKNRFQSVIYDIQSTSWPGTVVSSGNFNCIHSY